MNDPVARGGGGHSAPRVVVLEVRYQFFRNYNYLVVDPGGTEAVLVDPAWEMDKVSRAVADARARLSGILLTHAHPDHIHLAEAMSEEHRCPIWMSKVEIAASGYRARRLVGIDPVPWTVASMRIEPILTPGHTPGSLCFVIGDDAFTGDVLFAEGCGVCADTEAAHALFESLQVLKARLKPETRIFPGHSYGKAPGQRLAQLRRDNIYLQFTDKSSFAAYRLRRGQDAANMFGTGAR